MKGTTRMAMAEAEIKMGMFPSKNLRPALKEILPKMRRTRAKIKGMQMATAVAEIKMGMCPYVKIPRDGLMDRNSNSNSNGGEIIIKCRNRTDNQAKGSRRMA